MFYPTQVRQIQFPAGYLAAPAGARVTRSYKFGFIINQMALQDFFFLCIFFCKLGCFGYKNILLFWIQRIVKVSLLNTVLFLCQLTCCWIPVSTRMNQEVSSTHTTTTASVARIIMIDHGLAAVLVMLEPRQRSPSTLHAYVAEGGVINNEP